MSAEERRRYPGHRETTPSTPGMMPPSAASMSRQPSSVNLSRGPSSIWSTNNRPFSPVQDRDESLAEQQRLASYHLDVGEDSNEVRRLQRNKESRFYATDTVIDVRPDQLLPYRTESIREQYRYLAHIVQHIYIAIKSQDLKGNISIGVADLEKAKSIIMSGETAEEFLNSNEARDARADTAGTADEPNDERFEVLSHTMSEADEDDAEEGDQDSWYESDISSDDDGENMFASTPVSKVENRAASVIGLKYWTKELKNLLQIGVVPPATLASALVKVYYSVILSRGQSIDIAFYTDIIISLLKEADVLRDTGLRLPWEPVLKELEVELPSSNESTHLTDELRYKRIVRFAMAINTFFDEECIPHVMKKIMSRYSNQTVGCSFIQLAVMLPIVFKKPIVDASTGVITYDVKDIRHYMPTLFSSWTTQRTNAEISCLVSVLANIAEMALEEGSKHQETVILGKYGLFTRDQFVMIMTQLYLSTRMQMDDKQSKYVKLLVDLVVHSITSENLNVPEGPMDLFQTYCNSISTFVHPSNAGSWSTILSQTVKRFANTFHRRLLQERKDRSLVANYTHDFSGLKPEYKLSGEVIDKFVEVMLDLINLGVQSKSSGQRRRYIYALSLVCFMAPQRTLDTLLPDIYSSFDQVNSTHRITVILRELSAMVRYMAQLPVYRVHIPRLLSMLLPGVDSNDPQKTISTIGLVKLVATIVPFADLMDGEGDGGMLAMEFTSQHLSYLEAKFYETSPNRDQLMIYGEVPSTFAFDPETELAALKSASSSFSEFIRQFCDACFKYLEYSPNVEGDVGIESRASVLIPQTFDALVESLSDDLYNIVADKFFEYVTTNVKEKVSIVFSNLMEIIIRRDPHKQLPRFFNYIVPHILTELREGAGTTRAQEVLGKDARLIWYIKLLCGTILGAGAYTIQYFDDLQQLLAKCSGLKGESSYAVSLLVHSMMASVSCVRPLERRLVSPDWLLSHGGKVTEECWGGFQFDSYRFDKANLEFQWYQPTSEQIDPLVDLFESLTEEPIDRLQGFVDEFNAKSKKEIPLETGDQLSYDINILDGLVCGICTLFDPAFKPQMLQPAKILSHTEGAIGLSSAPSAVSLVSMAGGAIAPTSLGMDPANSLLQPMQPPEVVSSDVAIDNKFEGSVVQESGEMDDVDIDIISDSEMSSDLGSPVGDYEAVDGTLTDRSTHLYTFGYYFDGNDMAKLADPSYVKLHQTRERIGKVLHELALALIDYDGGIELVSHVIEAISGWLKNCGYFSSNNPLFVDNAHLINILDCAGTNGPYTRTIFGARGAIYHCNRMNISRCTRLPTDTDKLLIKDLVALAASSYTVSSYHATTVLTSVLNKIMNCTYLAFGIFKEWSAALSAKDEDKIKNILRLFRLRKFRGLAEKNSHQLRQYEELLVQSIEFDNIHITALALKLYGSIKKYVRVPAKVCMIDWHMIDAIRPPDMDIDRRIEAVYLAKENKKEVYLSLIYKLISRTIHRTAKQNLYWKFLLKSLELVSNLQAHFELPLNGEVLKVLSKSVNGIHPMVAKKCVIWMASILDVVATKGMYGYDLKKILSVDPPEPDMIELPGSDMQSFFTEMHNFDQPEYFVDSKFFVPTLAWGGNFKVISADYRQDSLGLNRKDEKAIRRFGAHVTKDWMLEILRLHIAESESNTVFMPGVAYLISSIVILCSHGYTPNLSLGDMFDLVHVIYDKEEKATHLVITEVYTGVLLGIRNSPRMCEQADAEISRMLEEVFHYGITQSTVNIWKIFCWWAPAHFDMRRCPKTVDLICNFDIDLTGKVSPFTTVSRVSFFKSYLSSLLNRYHDFDEAIARLFAALAHPYHIVSEKVAATLFDILLFTSTKRFNSFEEYDAANNAAPGGLGIFPYELPPQFARGLEQYIQKVVSLEPAVKGLSPQELVDTEYMYAVRGLYYLVLYILKTSHGDLIYDSLGPILTLLFKLDSMKDAIKLMNLHTTIAFYLIASVRFTKTQTGSAIKLLCNPPVKDPTLTQSQQILALNQAFYSVRRWSITDEQRESLVEKSESMLFSRYVEVREETAKYFTSVVHTYMASQSDAEIHKYIKKFNKVLNANKKKGTKKLGNEQIIQLHGATLGLGALIQAFPYTTPPPEWMPNVLTKLATKCSSVDGLVGRTAKDILSKFKKTRQDTWHIDSKFFTPEQLEDLEGVLWKSYFI